jgi:hypothetical protein
MGALVAYAAFKYLAMFGLIALTACTSTMHDVSLTGSVEGIRAYNDGLIGLAKTAVEPKGKSLYLNNRRQQESEITTRENNPTFWQMMAGAMKGGAK